MEKGAQNTAGRGWKVAVLLAPGLCQRVEASARSGFSFCSEESLAAAEMSRKLGRVKLLAGPHASSCIFLSQVHP